MVDGGMLTFDRIKLVSRHLAGLDIAGRAASAWSGASVPICAERLRHPRRDLRDLAVGRLRVADRGIREGILFDLMHGARRATG
jgi:exopolyphosphatase/guanosine-5'-triphosphate,3'-diphosphate pyrophosphatase